MKFKIIVNLQLLKMMKLIKTTSAIFLFCIAVCIGLKPIDAYTQVLTQTYDFNSLSLGLIHGQDNWKYMGNLNTSANIPGSVNCQIPPGFDAPPIAFDATPSGAYAGGIALKNPGNTGGSHGFTSRKNDGNWEYYVLTNSDFVILEFDYDNGNVWGEWLNLGFDANGDGDYSSDCKTADPNELGIGLGFALSNMELYKADGTVVSAARVGTGWTRYRLTIDLKANSGQGSGSICYKIMNASPAIWQPIPGLQNINMAINSSSAGRENLQNLNGMVVQQEAGGAGAFDNISIMNIKNNVLVNDTVCEGESITLNTLLIPNATSYSWTFNGTTLPATTTPSISLTNVPVSYSGNMVLVVSTNNCADLQWTVNFTVHPKPTVTPSASPSAICNGSSTTVSVSGANSYTWSPSGSGSSFIATPTSTTTYSVTGADANGCSNTSSVTVTVNALPTITASASPTSVCQGGSTTISAGGGSSYTWSPSGSGSIFTATPTSNTTYNVTGTDANGCTNTASVTVNVSPNLSVTASASPTSICQGGSTTISASGGSTYTWSPSGTGSSFTATPNSSTTYAVTGTDASGCSGTATVSVTVNALPTITASASPASICHGDSAVISANGGNTYTWSPSGSGSSFSVSPTSTTTYSVTGTDANGCSNTAGVAVTINPIPNITATASPSSICQGSSTTISANGGNSYIWSPSGSGSSFSASPSSNTTYSVTGTDTHGCTGTAEVIVAVNSNPSALFIADPLMGCEPTLVNFTDQSSGNISSWSWNFGDGSTSNSQNPSHSFGAGTFTITLTVTTAAGCQDSYTQNNYVNVLPNPVASFIADPAITTEDNSTITFINQSVGGSIYNWSFGDASGGTSFDMNPVYEYSGTGEYIVSLVVENAAGCIDSTSSVVTIRPAFTCFVPSAFSPNGDNKNDYFRVYGVGWDLDHFSMRVYSRWGELIFSSTDINHCWDGMMPDGVTQAPQEVYSVIIHIRGLDKNEYKYIKSVTLIR